MRVRWWTTRKDEEATVETTNSIGSHVASRWTGLLCLDYETLPFALSHLNLGHGRKHLVPVALRVQLS